MSGLRQQLPC